MIEEREMILVKQGGARFWVKDPEKIKFYKKLTTFGGVKGHPTFILKVKKYAIKK